jgi:hypothetical protein
VATGFLQGKKDAARPRSFVLQSFVVATGSRQEKKTMRLCPDPLFKKCKIQMLAVLVGRHQHQFLGGVKYTCVEKKIVFLFITGTYRCVQYR